MTQRYDAVIIGAGHNGLVCAFYLARAGLKVRMVERRDVVGGAAVTEEFHPGFRNSVASYTVSLLQPKVIADMRLAEHGYRVIERPISNFLPQEDGDYLKLGGGTRANAGGIPQVFARAMPRRCRPITTRWKAWPRCCEISRSRPRPTSARGCARCSPAAAQGWGVSRLPLETKRDVLDLFTKSATSFLGQWFESEAVKAAFGFDAVVGNYASPDTPGSAYVLLHHVFGEVNGKKGAWGHCRRRDGRDHPGHGQGVPRGGRRDHARGAGGRGAGRRRHGGGRAARERRGDRRRRASSPTSGPSCSTARCSPTSAQPEDFRRRMRGFKAGGGTFRMNVALSELPKFTCLPEPGEHHQSGIILAPTLAYMDRAFLDAKRYGWSKAPIVEMLIPSTVDDSLAPAGQHVASLFCQQFAPELPDGRDWDDEEEAAADTDHRHRRAPGARLPRLDPRPPGARPRTCTASSASSAATSCTGT